jgi:curved DNA-binding protein
MGDGGPAGGTYYQMSEEDLQNLFGGQSPFSDFFGTFFGGGTFSGMGGGRSDFSGMGNGRGRTQWQPYEMAGQDVEATIEVTLTQAYQGVTRVIELTEADGSTRRLEVKLPAGVADGARIRLAEQGEQGTSKRGDLYLTVHITPDARYTREGTTLRTRVEVPLTVSMLGGEVQVPTPDGRRLLLRIPEGTANGKAFRLRGQGMPALGKPETRGDLYAEVSVVLPTQLTPEQRRLFEAFARSLESGDGSRKEAA